MRMKYLKIPLDRVGVLIGQKGETKKNIEDKSLTYHVFNRLLSMISENHPILNLLAKLIQSF